MMKRMICVVSIFFLTALSSIVYAEDESEHDSILRLGLGCNVFFGTAGDGGGRINLHVLAARYAPFELEMNYTIARGIEFILLIDVIRSHYFNWHLFDIGLYFPMGTRLFNNLDLERTFDIVLGTGLDINVSNKPLIVVYLNVRFYFPDPNQIISVAVNRGEERVMSIGDRFTPEVLNDVDGFIEQEYEGIIDEFTNGITDVFRDVGRSVVISFGMTWYFN